MTAISGERANDARVKCLRIFADGNGETHMEDIDIKLQPKKLFQGHSPAGPYGKPSGFVVQYLLRP